MVRRSGVALVKPRITLSRFSFLLLISMCGRSTCALANISLGSSHWRDKQLISYLREQRTMALAAGYNFTVIDVGGSMNSWASSVTDVIMDMNPPNPHAHVRVFQSSSFNDPEGWVAAVTHVQHTGRRFDFCICTHTLEDLANPRFVTRMLERICKSGFIATPSKYVELSKAIFGRWTRELPRYRGYPHHRWVFTIRDGKWLGFPKQGFLEVDSFYDTLTDHSRQMLYPELSFIWKDAIDLQIVNSDFLGPNSQAIFRFYRHQLAQDDSDAWVARANGTLPVVPRQLDFWE